jgi:hypothetical protein
VVFIILVSICLLQVGCPLHHSLFHSTYLAITRQRLRRSVLCEGTVPYRWCWKYASLAKDDRQCTAYSVLAPDTVYSATKWPQKYENLQPIYCLNEQRWNRKIMCMAIHNFRSYFSISFLSSFSHKYYANIGPPIKSTNANKIRIRDTVLKYNFNAQFTIKEPRKHSPRRYGVRITIRAKDFVLPKSIRPVLGLGQPPMQWVPGFFAGGKVAWAWRWPPTSI